MKIKSVIFSALLCAEVYACAMNPWSNGPKSLWEVAWERHQEERRQAFEKLGEPMPEGPTYEEAVRMHLKDKIQNEQARSEDMRKQEENKKNEADPK